MSDQSGKYPYLWGVSQQGQVSLVGQECVINNSSINPKWVMAVLKVSEKFIKNLL